MRILLFTLFFTFSLLSLKAQTGGYDMVAPLDSVPGFVKEKVSPELYEMLETLSHTFRINYSFLSDEMYPEREDFVCDFFKRFYDAVKAGKMERKADNVPILSPSLPFKRHTDVNWEWDMLYRVDEHTQFCKRSAIVYTGKYSDEAKIRMEIWYLYDADKQQVLPVKAQLSSVGEGTCGEARWIFNEKTRETGTYLSTADSRTLTVQFSTLFSYEGLPSGRSRSEPVQRQFAIPLE